MFFFKRRARKFTNFRDGRPFMSDTPLLFRVKHSWWRGWFLLFYLVRKLGGSVGVGFALADILRAEFYANISLCFRKGGGVYVKK